MPATDDEVMEVEDLIVDEQIELPVVMNTGTAECISNESTSGKPQKESSEGIDSALTKYSTFHFSRVFRIPFIFMFCFMPVFLLTLVKIVRRFKNS